MSRYANKRAQIRSSNGRFRRTTGKDFGIGGVCPTPGCRHLLIIHYDGPKTGTPDPRAFRYRCFHCEPLTDAEKQAQQDTSPKFDLIQFFKDKEDTP